MISRVLVVAALVSALGAPAAARAAYPSRPVGVLLRLGLDFGGDTLVDVGYSDGSNKKIKAGELYYLSGGLLIRPPVPLALEVTGGWKSKKLSASNGSIKFTRYPVDFIGSFVLDTAQIQHRLGGGATVHLSPKLSCDVSAVAGGFSCSGSATLKNSWGGIAQYVISVPFSNSGIEFGLRYTWMKYKAKVAGVPSIDGNSFGFFFGGWI